MTLQERFPSDTSRIVLANALYHTCCLCPLQFEADGSSTCYSRYYFRDAD